MMIRTLRPHEIFVFGSNTTGRHGKGAALQARTSFGAKQGVGEGLTGACYAFPTLDHKFQRRSMIELAKSRDLLYEVCDDNPSKTFLLTKVGCGLAGFPERDMMALFTCHPTNLVLPEDWE